MGFGFGDGGEDLMSSGPRLAVERAVDLEPRKKTGPG